MTSSAPRRRRPRRRRGRGHQRHPPHASRSAARERGQAGRPLGHAARRSAHRRRDGPRPDGGLPRAGHGRRRRHRGDEGAPGGRARLRGRPSRPPPASPTTWTRCARSACAWWARAPRTRCCAVCRSDAAAEVACGDLDAAALTESVAPARRGAGVLRRGRCRAGPRLRAGRFQPVLRFSLWEQAVEERRRVGDLFYDAGDVPPALTRLRAAAGAAASLAGDAPALVADTGPAALYGALPPGGTTPCWSTSATVTRSACWPSRAAWPACSSTTRSASTGRPRAPPAALAGRRPRQRRGARRPRHGAVLAPGAGTPTARPAAHRHRATPRAARRQRAAGRVRGASRGHDAHRLLRPAARAARAARATRERAVP